MATGPNGQRYQYFRGNDGRDVVYDWGTGNYYDQSNGFVKDPVTGEWKDPNPKQPKGTSPMAAVGIAAAGPIAYGAGQYIGNNAGNLFGTTQVANSTPVGYSGVGPVANPNTYSGMLGTSGGAAPAAQGAGSATSGMSSLGANTASTGYTGASGLSSLGYESTAAAPYGYMTDSAGSAIGTSMGETAAVETGANAGSSWMGTAGNVAAGAAAAYGLYQLGTNVADNQKDGKGGAMSGATTGAAVGSYFGPWGTVIGGVLGALAGLAVGQVGGNKDVDQRRRDAVRKGLKQTGVLKDDYSLTLADGNKFDIGLDGDAMLKNVDGTERRAFDVDFNNPLAAQVVGYLDPLAAVLTGGDKKLRNDFAGYYTNAALSSGDPRQNAIKLYADHGIKDPQSAINLLDELQKTGRITKEERDIFANGAATLFNGAPKPSATAPAPAPATQPAPPPTAPQVQTLPGRPATPPTQQQIQGISGMAAIGRKPRMQGTRTYV